MKELISNNELTMSSREIAELLSKNHSNIKISAERMIEKGTIAMQGLKKYEHNGNEYTEYLFNKRDSVILVAQNCPEFTAAIVDRWQELENQQPALPDFNNPVESARAWADAKESEQKALEIIEQQKPAVEFVENYVQASTGSKTFREVCKILKVKENVFRAFLVENKIMYKSSGGWLAHAQHINAGRFETKTGVKNEHSYTTTKFTGKGVEWIAGEYTKAAIREIGLH